MATRSYLVSIFCLSIVAGCGGTAMEERREADVDQPSSALADESSSRFVQYHVAVVIREHGPGMDGQFYGLHAKAWSRASAFRAAFLPCPRR